MSELLDWVKDKKQIAIDIETRFGNIDLPYKGKTAKSQKLDLSKLNPYEHEILLFQIGNDEDQFIIDCRYVDITPLIDYLKSRPDLTIIGHNLKYDISWLNVKFGYIPNKMFDTMLTEKCLTMGLYDLEWDSKAEKLKNNKRNNKPYSLNSLAKRHLGFDYDTDQLSLFEPKCPKKIRDSFPSITSEAISDEQITYARYDVIIPYRLYKLYNKEKLPKIVDIENEYLKVLISMETYGIKLNKENWVANSLIKQKEAFEILEKLNEFGEINWKSPKQKLELLTKMGYEPMDKYGKQSTSKEALKKLNNDIADLLLKLSETNKAADAFGIKFLSYLNPKTDKLHTSFNQMVINGRLSSSSPNLQQVPRENSYRNCFYEPEGVTICDYSSMEIRRVAEVANEKALIDALNSGLDPHLETAKKLFDLEGKDEKYIAGKRTIGKTLNFSIVYGVSAFKLANDYNVPKKEAQGWINDYFRTYPNIKKYLDKTRNFALKNGYTIIDKYGRKCYHPEWPRYKQLQSEITRQMKLSIPIDKKLTSELIKLEGDIERRSGNVVISGSCATINKLAGIFLYKKGIQLLLAVHDENVVLGDQRDVIVQEMEKSWKLLNSKTTMPLKAEFEETWKK